ncbi:hypothetical protein OH492_12530 [Vibrio chagasii]|nr:hypothetical protein [Vibrio chagasii]
MLKVFRIASEKQTLTHVLNTSVKNLPSHHAATSSASAPAAWVRSEPVALANQVTPEMQKRFLMTSVPDGWKCPIRAY